MSKKKGTNPFPPPRRLMRFLLELSLLWKISLSLLFTRRCCLLVSACLIVFCQVETLLFVVSFFVPSRLSHCLSKKKKKNDNLQEARFSYPVPVLCSTIATWHQNDFWLCAESSTSLCHTNNDLSSFAVSAESQADCYQT